MFYPETADFQAPVSELEQYQVPSCRCCQGPPS